MINIFGIFGTTEKEKEPQREPQETETTPSKFEIPRLNFNPEEQKELKEFFNMAEGEKKEERKKEIEKKYKPKIERYQQQLDKEMSTAPSSSAFEGFVKDKSLTSEGLYLAEKKIEKTSVLSEEEIRVLMGRILSAKPQLKMFFEKHCLLKYLTLDQDDDPKEAGGAEITTIEKDGRKKFQIQVDAGSIMNEFSTISEKTGKKITIRYPDLNKFSFIMLQSLSQLIPKPEKMIKIWTQKRKNNPVIDKNSVTNWSDFFCLCIMDPDAARNINPEAFGEFEDFMDNAALDPVPIIGKIQVKNPNIDYDYIYNKGPKEEKMTKWYDRFRFSNLFGYRIVWQEGIDWDERAQAEFDAKEVSRILAREEGIVQRDNRLFDFIKWEGWENKDHLRRLLLADSQTGDLARWRLQLYAWKYDPLFKKTNGKEITQETYVLFERCRRHSEKVRRMGTKPIEYRWDKSLGRAVRKSYREYQEEVNEEWRNKTNREAQGTLAETFQHMQVNGRFIGVDEKWGENLDNPNSDGWFVSTGDLRKLIGADNARAFLSNIREFYKDDKGWLNKLEPDQRAAIGRFGLIISSSGVGRGDMLFNEHTKPITREAYLFYKDKIAALEDKKKQVEVEPEEEIITESIEPEKVIDSYKKIKKTENETQEKKIDPIVDKTKLKSDVKKALKDIIKESYDKGREYIEEQIFEHFQVKKGWKLTDEEKDEIKKVLSQTREFRAKIIESRRRLKALELQPYIDLVKKAREEVTPEARTLQELLTNQLELVSLRQRMGQKPEDVIDLVMGNLKTDRHGLVGFGLLKKLEELEKEKDLDKFTKRLTELSEELPKKVDVENELYQLTQLKQANDEMLHKPAGERENFPERRRKLQANELWSKDLVPEGLAPETDEELAEVIKKIQVADKIYQIDQEKIPLEEEPVEEKGKKKGKEEKKESTIDYDSD